MYKDYDNYRTYENDDLSAGATLKVCLLYTSDAADE